jgi:hypothetical protein
LIIYSEALLALPTLTGFKQEAPSPPNGDHGYENATYFLYIVAFSYYMVGILLDGWVTIHLRHKRTNVRQAKADPSPV